MSLIHVALLQTVLRVVAVVSFFLYVALLIVNQFYIMFTPLHVKCLTNIDRKEVKQPGLTFLDFSRLLGGYMCEVQTGRQRIWWNSIFGEIQNNVAAPILLQRYGTRKKHVEQS